MLHHLLSIVPVAMLGLLVILSALHGGQTDAQNLPVAEHESLEASNVSDEAKASARKRFQLGVQLAKEQKWALAEIEYYHAIGDDPTLAAAYTNLGVALSAQGKPHRAILYHLKAIELNPSLAQAHVNLAVDFAMMGNYREAWDHIHAAQALDHPIDPELLKRLSSRMPDSENGQ